MNDDAGAAAPALDAWTRWNAVFVLSTVGIALFVGRAWPVAACGVASLGALAASNRGAWTRRGRFGWANTVTATRAAIVGAVGAWPGDPSAGLLAPIGLGL